MRRPPIPVILTEQGRKAPVLSAMCLCYKLQYVNISIMFIVRLVFTNEFIVYFVLIQW